MFQGGCKGGPGGPEALQPAVNTKNEINVPELYVKPITQHPVLCAGGSSRTNGSRYPPLSARRGLPGWLQPALLPDPTTAASERSSVNRLAGSRRRGSGINRHRSRTVSKPSLRGRHRVQAHPGGCRARASATSRKTRKIRQTFRSCLSSLTRSCIQDCVQEVPVGPMAQGTPPSAHAAAFQGGFNGLHQLLHLFYQVSSEVFSKSSSVMSSLLLL